MEQPQTEFYLNDFDFILTTDDAESQPVQFPTSCDWWIDLYSVTNSSNRYRASYIDGQCTNCFNDDGAIHIVCNDHHLPTGALRAELYLNTPNPIYPDGKRLTGRPFNPGITLTPTAGTLQPGYKAQVSLPAILVTAYDLAVTQGYEGTAEEYSQSLAQIPAIASLLTDAAAGKQKVINAVAECGVEVPDDPTYEQLAESIHGNLAKFEEMGYFKKLGYTAEDMGLYHDQLALADDLRRTWETVKSKYWLDSYNKSLITIIPKVDTSVLTDMSNMFYGCTSLQTIPQLDTSNVTSMYSMLQGCSTLHTIPLLDTSKVTNMAQMFLYCTPLQTIPQLDTSNVTSMYSMFTGCSTLHTIPLLDTSKVTNMAQMFLYCTPLQTIPLLDVAKVTNIVSMFAGCATLTICHLKNLKISVSFKDSALLAAESVAYIVAHAANTSAITITLHATAYQRAIADADVQAALAEHPLVTLASA